ncbi:MAG TPA: MaoC/PaaZ C-terminal domain-containing protein [Candidatus Dormibacteraeota bacterium]|nr:MaoC/PaaZ C-terminal domain-containing protein [Candidatus Dormibacteraeota bacterium]
MSGTFERATIGDRWISPELKLDERCREVIAWAGYVFPLFSDEGFARRAGFAGVPVPGELVLLLLGGLAEQTGAFDEATLALTGLNAVRFRTPCLVGDTIRLEMEVVGKELSSSGRRGLVTFAWTCRNQRGEAVLSAEATLAFRTDRATD